MSNDLKSIKHYLRNEGSLMLGDNFNLTEKNPADFVRNYMLSYYKTYSSYYSGSKIIQTDQNCSRSASDIFRITYYYFPKVKLITVYRVIFALLKEGIICTDICGDINKRVYFKYSYTSSTIGFYGAYTDETGLDFKSLPEFDGIKALDVGSDSKINYFNIPKI